MDNLKYIFKSWWWKSFGSVLWTLAWFNIQIVKKLWKNRHKGNKMRWSMDSQSILFEKLKEEVEELEVEILIKNSFPNLYNKKNVVSEASDVAAFAMMVADRAHSKDFL